MKKRRVFLIVFMIFITIICLTIAYAAFSDDMSISSAVSNVRVDKVVRINNVTSSSSAVSELDFSSKSILNTVYIPAGGSVTYNVTVTNLGNVPVAVSNVSFTSGGNAVNNLSASIDPSNYQKVCDNGTCTGGVSRVIPVTITNNGSSTIDANLDVNLTFTEVYEISHDSTVLGEALAGSNYTYNFSGNGPTRLSKVSGTCDNYTYSNGTLSITNVGSDLVFTEAYTITYNGEVIGTIADGATFTKNLEPEFPVSVTVESGTYTNQTYTNHVLTITNIRSDIVVTGVIGKVEITRIQYVQDSAKNVLDNPIPQPVFHDMDASFDITFQRPEGSTETDFEITYEVDITNTHYNDYIFRGLDFHPVITASAGSDTANLNLIPVGINNGDTIASGTTKTFTVTLKLDVSNPDGSYSTSTNTQVDTTPDTESETGTIVATVTPLTGNLKSPNTRATFTVEVTNTYPSDKEFTLISSNSNFVIIPATSFPLTVHGESTEQYTVYVEVAQGATFINNTSTMTMYLSSSGMANITVDTITFDVDVYDVPDTTKVTVSNATMAYYYDKSDNRPKIKATWNRDDVGGTRVTDYVVGIYTTNGNLVQTCHTYSATRECLFAGLNSGTTYYVIVYGIDEATNTGETYVGSANQNPGYATRSANASFTWQFSVNTSNVSNLAVGGDGNTAILGAPHTITVTASGSSNGIAYTAPESVTVTMAGSSGDFYTYGRSGSNNTVGTIYIAEVTGNISVTAQRAGGCLIEGTKILLANGKYKNIEDIKYDDLVMAYSYDTGTLVPTYPIFIETAITADKYQKATFSDGTILETFNYHGVYETELKRFVSVDNPKEFHVGSKIAKISKDGKGYEEVTVTKIEEIHESARFYLFASTRYFNAIANDIITTDGNVALSNLYGFNDDMTWPKEIRENALKDVYTYDELADVTPYYMYKGMRAGEGKFLANFGLELSTYRQFIRMINDARLVHPINVLGRNMWMVTTSLDKVNEINKSKYLYPEGYIYTLPSNNNVVSWFNTADSRFYKPGDKVTIYHGTHFVANYK